jgi:hypothetical protein
MYLNFPLISRDLKQQLQAQNVQFVAHPDVYINIVFKLAYKWTNIIDYISSRSFSPVSSLLNHYLFQSQTGGLGKLLDGMAKTDEIADISIEMPNLDRILASSTTKKLCHDSPSLLESSIFRVPHKLRRRNANVYDPNIVSIGPFHCGTKRLVPMDEIKMW